MFLTKVGAHKKPSAGSGLPTIEVDRLKIGLVVVLAVLLLTLSVPLEAVAQNDVYHEDFEWTYDQQEWTWSLDIPKSLYNEYKQVPVSTRTKDGPGGFGFLTTTNDDYLQQVADKLNEATLEEEYDTYDEVSFVLAFVQSLPYTEDSVTSKFDEYPRFPLETLADNGGDCEDTAILFATIIKIMGYGVIYINPPEHYAVGVLGEDLPGYYWDFEGERYYYCETTGNDWKIGDLPDSYKEVEAYTYSIDASQQYIPGSDTSGLTDYGFDSLFGLLVLAGAAFLILLVIIAVIILIRAQSQKIPQPGDQHVFSESSLPKSPAPSPAPQTGTDYWKFCRYCGSKNMFDAAFCDKCGRKIA